MSSNYSVFLLSFFCISLSFAMMLPTISAASPDAMITFVVRLILKLLAVSSSITLTSFLLVVELSIDCGWFAFAMLLEALLLSILGFLSNKI